MSEVGSPEARERSLLARLKAVISLSRAQAFAGLVAAVLSIGGSIYGYLKVTQPPDKGELLTVVHDRGDKPLPDAIVEVLTDKDAIVTSFSAVEPAGSRRTLKEGTYRLRVTHPKLAPEIRTVQVYAGQTSEIRFRLGPRAAVAKPAPAGTSPVNDATRVVTEGVENFKKIFR